MVWCGVVWCGMAWRGMAWHGMAWYGMAWYGMTWHSTVRYDVASQFFCFIFFLIYEQIAEKHGLNLLVAINSQTLLILSIPKLD